MKQRINYFMSYFVSNQIYLSQGKDKNKLCTSVVTADTNQFEMLLMEHLLHRQIARNIHEDGVRVYIVGNAHSYERETINI